MASKSEQGRLSKRKFGPVIAAMFLCGGIAFAIGHYQQTGSGTASQRSERHSMLINEAP
jgi:hypothetical protein